MDYDGFLKSLTICVSQRVKKQGRCVGIPEIDRTYKLKGFSCRVKLLGGKSDMCQQRRTTEAQTPVGSRTAIQPEERVLWKAEQDFL